MTGVWAWELDFGSPRQPAPQYAWPIPANLIRPVPTDGGSRYFDAYKFVDRGQLRHLSLDQVFYAWRPSQLDPRQPESVLQAARLDVSTAIMLSEYSVGFLRNNAMPAAAVVTQAFENSEQKAAFQAQFQSNYRGPPPTPGGLRFLRSTATGTAALAGCWTSRRWGAPSGTASLSSR